MKEGGREGGKWERETGLEEVRKGMTERWREGERDRESNR